MKKNRLEMYQKQCNMIKSYNNWALDAQVVAKLALKRLSRSSIMVQYMGILLVQALNLL